MMTLPLGSAVHHGYSAHQQPLEDNECINPSFLNLSYPPDMTRSNNAGYGYPGQQPFPELSNWTLDLQVDDQSFPTEQYSTTANSDGTRSPGRNSHPQSSDDACSPFSQIASVYTPSSTHDYDASVNNESSEGAFEDEDDPTKSPLTDSIFSTSTDGSFFMVNYPDSRQTPPTGQPASLMSSRPQPGISGASAQVSRSSSVAKSSSPNHASSASWHQPLTTVDMTMTDNNAPMPNGAFNASNNYFQEATAFTAPSQDLQDHSYRDLETLSFTPHNSARNAAHASFRTFDDGSQQTFGDYQYTAGSPFGQTFNPSQQLREQQHWFANQYQQSQTLFPQPTQPIINDAFGQPGMSATQSTLANEPAAMPSASYGMAQADTMPIRSQPTRIVVHQPSATATPRSIPYPHSREQSAGQITTHRQPQLYRKPESFVPSSHSTAPSRRVHLAPREDLRAVVPSNAPSMLSHAANSRKGGRGRNTHLRDDVRQQSSKMRRVTACWRCALQRDKCDEGDVCRRCNIRSQRGQSGLFGCDRSKLPDWVDDLLPLSMTELHSRHSIERFVSDQVTQWDTSNSIDIYLTCGYGPALVWRCCEFKPKGQELLSQLQYLQETSTGSQQSRFKYSPPFALEKLDESDDSRFQDYLDQQLMHPTHLQTLGYTFFEEECMVDPDCFQAQVLQLMCTLYLQTRDPQLHEILQDVIRMLIVTYIMGHTLTIAEDTLPSVIASLRHNRQVPCLDQHTSPRLANRQLKHYFSSLRHNMYVKVLHRQQQTFHDSKKKEAHWLVSFCAMLGFAMVLEEIQRTIQIQADAKVQKREMTEEHANAEALNHCQRIDARFELLTLLFQKKYRDKKWTDDGSFGPGTPKYSGAAESQFLAWVYELLVQKQSHLRSRESVPLGPQHQCKYTTRLVAKFLLPFLNLPS